MEKSGILYTLSNISWNNLLKCGVTTQSINKRVSNIQTGNPINCKIVYTTDNLLYPYYYERLLKQRLEKQSFNREFFEINEEVIIKIYDEFNVMNKILNCEELILLHMKNNDKSYYKKIVNKKINVEEINYNFHDENDEKIKYTYSLDKRKRKKKGYYVNTG